MNSLIEIWKEMGQLEKSVYVVVFFAITYAVLHIVVIRKLEKITAMTSNDLDDRIVHFVKQFLGIFAFFFAIIVVLKINHIEISPILAGAGIFGIAVGLAAKETLADILSGIFLIADRPVRIGDRVKIENIGRHWGAWGDVTDIGLRRTRIRNTDGVIVNYPNSVLSNSVINNFTFEQEPVRVRIRFQVDYQADLAKTIEVAAKAINAIPEVMDDTMDIVIRSLWDDNQGHQMAGILIEGRYRIEDVKCRTPIRSKVLQSVHKALKENNIPYAAQPVKLVEKE